MFQLITDYHLLFNRKISLFTSWTIPVFSWVRNLLHWRVRNVPFIDSLFPTVAFGRTQVYPEQSPLIANWANCVSSTFHHLSLFFPVASCKETLVVDSYASRVATWHAFFRWRVGSSLPRAYDLGNAKAELQDCMRLNSPYYFFDYNDSKQFGI